MIERLDVTDPAAAAIFASLRARHILLALVHQERTQSELGALVGVPLNLLRYHLDRLIAARLVEMTRLTARRGRAIRHYRATARSFFVPAELAAPVPNRMLMEELARALETARAGTYSGIVYGYRDGPRMDVVRDRKTAHPAADLWQRMSLNDADAAALIEELRALFARFARRETDAGQHYVMLGAVAPI